MKREKLNLGEKVALCEAIEILKDQSAYQNINRCVWTRVTLFTI